MRRAAHSRGKITMRTTTLDEFRKAILGTGTYESAKDTLVFIYFFN